jgi:hypothetical protein
MIIDSPIISGSLILTGSAAFTGSLTLSGSMNTIGTITATTLVVQTITSSISSITGSTQFGSSSINTHQFTGSVYISGSTTGSVLNINRTAALNAGTYVSQSLVIRGSVGLTTDPADGVARLTLIGDSNTGDGTIDWGGNGNFNLRFTNNGNERIRITSGGNLLIGRTSDGLSTAKLQVSGGPFWMDFSTYAYFNSRYNNTSNYGNIIFNNGAGQNLWFGETATNVFSIGNGSAGSAIGTTVAIRWDLSSGANYMPSYGNGTMSISSGQITTSSDKNLKIDDGGINNALDKVLNLNPRYFYWKKDSGIEDTDRHLGFYAQDVQEALGVEVANDNSSGRWGIYDRGIIAMLTKAIQELNIKLEAANAEIEALKSK